MSKQSEWQARKVMEGRCPHCGGVVVPGRSGCERELRRQREAARRRRAGGRAAPRTPSPQGAVGVDSQVEGGGA